LALDDANSILLWWFGGFRVSRAFAAALGVTGHRYYWALGLLRAARVCSSPGVVILCDSMADCQRRVKVKYDALVNERDALDRLRIFMPKNFSP
jgi:hypothetical protein